MEKSTNKVEVTRIRLENHPNADSLMVARIFDGFTCCVKKGDFIDGQLAAYVPPDSVVDSTRHEFSFLVGHERVKVKKLRGVVSMGLLLYAPEWAKEGDNLAEHFGVTHYEPPLPILMGGEAEKPPEGYIPVFDVDNLRRYAHVFQDGEIVVATEKIDGANARFCYKNNKMHCGSRTQWKREDEKNLWWHALQTTPELEEFCKEHQDIVIYGEIYGQVQDLKYGTRKGEVRIAVFDFLWGNEWVDPLEARSMGKNLPWVPSITNHPFPFHLEEILQLAEGPSLIPGANHIREGIVVRPIKERTDLEIGRVCLKVVSNAYLERK